jgi:hypothetical protein
MANATAARGLAPAAVLRCVTYLNRLALPACIPLVLILLLLGVAAVALGWWVSLPAILPGDEFYAVERVTELTVRTFTGVAQAPDAPQRAMLTDIGVVAVGAALFVLVVGALLGSLKASIHVRLMCSARDLRLLLVDAEAGIGIAAATSQSTTARLLVSTTPVPSASCVCASLSSEFLAHTLPRCAGRVSELLALSQDTETNLDLARRLIAARRISVQVLPLKRMRLRVDSRAQRLAVGRDGLAELKEAATDLRLTSLPEARCRRLLREQPPNKVRVFDLEGRPALVIVGLRNTGIELLARACAQAQSPCFDPLVIALVDTEAPAVARDLRLACPALSLAVELVPVALEASLPQSAATLLAMLSAAGLTPTSIYLALEDPALTNAWDRELALASRTFGHASPLVLPVRYPQRRDSGLLDEEEALDALPRQRHAAYLEHWRSTGAPPSEATVDWPALPFDYQEDNRSLADHLWTKARDLDLRIAPAIPGLAALPTSADVEQLAIAEHRRWVASRAIAGWRFGASRSDAQRIHPLLVDWSALSDAERAKDRDVVIELPQVLAAAGLGLQPLASFAVPPDACRDADFAALMSCARRAAQRVGDGAVPHLIVAVDSAASFKLAQQVAAQRDMAVSLVLAQALSGLASAAGQASQAAALMQSAWTVWLTRPDTVERVLTRWHTLPGDS